MRDAPRSEVGGHANRRGVLDEAVQEDHRHVAVDATLDHGRRGRKHGDDDRRDPVGERELDETVRALIDRIRLEQERDQAIGAQPLGQRLHKGRLERVPEVGREHGDNVALPLVQHARQEIGRVAESGCDRENAIARTCTNEAAAGEAPRDGCAGDAGRLRDLERCDDGTSAWLRGQRFGGMAPGGAFRGGIMTNAAPLRLRQPAAGEPNCRRHSPPDGHTIELDAEHLCKPVFSPARSRGPA